MKKTLPIFLIAVMTITSCCSKKIIQSSGIGDDELWGIAGCMGCLFDTSKFSYSSVGVHWNALPDTTYLADTTVNNDSLYEPSGLLGIGEKFTTAKGKNEDLGIEIINPSDNNLGLRELWYYYTHGFKLLEMNSDTIILDTRVHYIEIGNKIYSIRNNKVKKDSLLHSSKIKITDTVIQFTHSGPRRIRTSGIFGIAGATTAGSETGELDFYTKLSGKGRTDSTTFKATVIPQ